MSSSMRTEYAGDVDAEEAWRVLAEEPGAVLIDVRTRAEWGYVGLADLAALGKRPVLAEWQSFPTMEVRADFADALSQALEAGGVGRGEALLFLCRSGARSLAAARAMTAAGYDRCFNVADGFEGPLDAEGHRGRVGGWKALGLPWRQG